MVAKLANKAHVESYAEAWIMLDLWPGCESFMAQSRGFSKYIAFTLRPQ